MGKVVLLRGLSGCGKSTKAMEMYWAADDCGKSAVICSADKYFERPDGYYAFDAKELPQAHQWCQQEAEMAMVHRVDLVIIDNTNTRRWEMEPYLKMANRYMYEVEEVIVGGKEEKDIQIYASRNKHGVPIESIRRMASRWED
jgi:predicted kinase